MNTRQYQLALIAAIAVCVALGTALAFVLLHIGLPVSSSNPAEDTIIARGPSAPASPVTAGAPALTSTESGSHAPLASIQVSPQRLQEIGVTVAKVISKDVSNQLNVPGNVDIDEEKLAYVQTRFPGWIQDVYANATYQFVHKGDRLFTVYSPDLVSSEQEYLLARQNQKTFSPRMQSGSSEGKPTAGDNMAARESSWLLKAAEDRLRQFGIPEQAIISLEKTGKVQRNIAIDSPASGYITERNALPNAYVQPENKLYTIADLSTIWVYANVFQDSVGELRPGDPAQVTVDAYPGRTFRGRIDQILPQVDLATRTVRVRLVFRNQGILLKPGMYVNVAIHVPLGRHLLIPASAVLQSGQQAIAFVDHGQGYLEARTIEVGPQLGDSVVVLSGLKAGEMVVSSANFLLDSEAQLQAALNGFAPSQVRAEMADNSTNSQAQIVLSTQPDPPRRGSNTFQVRLTGADGRPVTGAKVMATFFMPAMPAMGMAAERAQASLTERGNGIYQGALQLSTGGSWQVTISVTRGAQTLATKQMNLDVTGGM